MTSEYLTKQFRKVVTVETDFSIYLGLIKKYWTSLARIAGVYACELLIDLSYPQITKKIIEHTAEATSSDVDDQRKNVYVAALFSMLMFTIKMANHLMGMHNFVFAQFLNHYHLQH